MRKIIMSDCGCDGIEDIPLTYPTCCGKHLKEARDYATNQFKKSIANMIVEN